MNERPLTPICKRRGHNEGSIYRRKDGRWTGVLTIGGGKRKYYYGRTRGEVQAKLASAAAGLNNGLTPPASERLTVGQFLTGWLSDTVKPSVRPSTFRGYESKVRAHILPGLSKHPLVKLTPQRLEAFFNQANGRPFAPDGTAPAGDRASRPERCSEVGPRATERCGSRGGPARTSSRHSALEP